MDEFQQIFRNNDSKYRKSLWCLLLSRPAVKRRYLSQNYKLQSEQQTGSFCSSYRLCNMDKRQHEIKQRPMVNSRLKLIFMADFLENVLSVVRETYEMIGGPLCDQEWTDWDRNRVRGNSSIPQLDLATLHS